MSLAANAPTWSDNEGDSARIDEQTWDYDYFGHLVDHNDLTGHDYNYGYDANSGMQTSEYSPNWVNPPALSAWQLLIGQTLASGINLETLAHNRVYTYYDNGLIKQIADPSGLVYNFEYDANGNRTMEETITVDGRGTMVHTITRTGYDSHNRVAHVTTDDVLTNQRTLDLTYDYDADGNRRRVVVQSGYDTYYDDGDQIIHTDVDAISTTDQPIQVSDASLDGQTFKSGVSGSFTLRPSDVFQDPEGRTLTYSVQALGTPAWPGWLTATFNAATGLYTFAATSASSADLGQTYTIELKATDAATGATATTVFHISVASNTGPTLLDSVTPTVNAKTGQALDLSLLARDYFRDVDIGDRLTLSINSVTPSAPWLGIDTSDGDVVHLTGVPTATGTYTIYLKATDLSGATVVKMIALTVSNPVAPTAVSPTLSNAILIGRGFAFDRRLGQLFTDLNGDALNVTAKLDSGAPLPSWMNFGYEPGDSGRVQLLSNGVPTGTIAGQVFRVVLTATDSDGLSASLTLELTATNPPTTDSSPVVGTAIPNQSAVAGTLWTYTVPSSAFVDPDGDSIAVAAGSWGWIPEYTIYHPGDVERHIDPYTTTVAAHYGWVGLPSWLSFDASTFTFSGTPPASADATTLTLNLVTAFSAQAAQQVFSVSIAAGGVVQPPVTPPPAPSPTANRQEYWFTYDAESRVQVVNGDLTNGQIVIGGYNPKDVDDKSYALSYDAAGHAVSRFTRGGNVNQSIYSQRGEVVAEYSTYATNVLAGATLTKTSITTTRTYDAAGRLTDERHYLPQSASKSPVTINGTLYSVSTSGWEYSRLGFGYDADGRLTSQDEFGRSGDWLTAAWNLDGGNQAAMDARQTTDAGLTSLAHTTFSFDNVGRANGRTYNHYAWEGKPYVEPGQPAVPDIFVQSFTYTYEARDSYLEKSVAGTSSTDYYKASTSTSTYDAYGRRIAVQEDTPLPAKYGVLEKRVRFFSYDSGAGILTRRDGTLDADNHFTQGQFTDEILANNQHYTYVNGQSVAHLTEAGKIDVLSGLTAYDTQALGAGTAVVQEGDTLRGLAQRIYGDSGLWYVLAEANAVSKDSDLVVGTTLRTPEVKTTANSANTFKPYNPGDVIGDTTPTLPHIAKPPAAGCNPMMIIMIIVAIVVTIYTAGAASGLVGLATSAGTTAAGTAAIGTAALAGGAAAGTTLVAAGGLAAATSVGFASAVAAGIGAFAGSVASQLVGKALGVVDHFSLRQAVGAGVTAGLTAGIGSTGVIGTIAGESRYAQNALTAVAGTLTAYAGNRIAGVEDTHFSWRSVAASAVASVITTGISDGLGKIAPSLFKGDGSRGAFVTGMIGGIVSLHARRAFGFDDNVDYGQIAADTFGNFLGNQFVEEMQQSRTENERRGLLAKLDARATQIGQLKELPADENAFYIEPEQMEVIGEALKGRGKLAQNDSVDALLQRAGIENQTQFEWSRSGETVRSYYSDATTTELGTYLTELGGGSLPLAVGFAKPGVSGESAYKSMLDYVGGYASPTTKYEMYVNATAGSTGYFKYSDAGVVDLSQGLAESVAYLDSHINERTKIGRNEYQNYTNALRTVSSGGHVDNEYLQGLESDVQGWREEMYRADGLAPARLAAQAKSHFYTSMVTGVLTVLTMESPIKFKSFGVGSVSSRVLSFLSRGTTLEGALTKTEMAKFIPGHGMPVSEEQFAEFSALTQELGYTKVMRAAGAKTGVNQKTKTLFLRSDYDMGTLIDEYAHMWNASYKGGQTGRYLPKDLAEIHRELAPMSRLGGSDALVEVDNDLYHMLELANMLNAGRKTLPSFIKSVPVTQLRYLTNQARDFARYIGRMEP